MSRPHVSRGITLPQVLAVMFASMVFGCGFLWLGSGRSVPLSRTCIYNLRQIGVCSKMYLADYDGKFPFAGEEFVKEFGSPVPRGRDAFREMFNIESLLSPYRKDKSIFECPQDDGLRVLDFLNVKFIQEPGAFKASGSSYWYNEDLYFSQKAGLKVENSAEAILVMDRTGRWHGGKWNLPDPPASSDDYRTIYLGYRYNALSTDLHRMKRLTPGEVNRGRGAALGRAKWIDRPDMPSVSDTETDL